MKLLLINQFGPASGAPTGRILADLASELRQRGHQVFWLTTSSAYGKPRKGIGRMLDEGLAHLRLLVRGLGHSRVDAVISLTSPACLAVTAGIIARLHRARHFPWVMDVYPDLGVRLGEVRDGALVTFLAWLMRRAYRAAAGVVVLDEDMRDHLRSRYEVDSAVIEPFPPEIIWPPVGKTPGPLKRWLYSGNFGRAHEIEVLLQIQRRLEDQHIAAELILQGQGPQFLSSQEAARLLGLRQVRWQPPVPMEKLGESLLESDVLVVTRKAELKGLLLPSKLVLAELSGRAVLWIGDTDGKTAQRLAAEGRHGVFSPAQVDAIAAWLQGVFRQETSAFVVPPRTTESAQQQAVRQWEALLLHPPEQKSDPVRLDAAS